MHKYRCLVFAALMILPAVVSAWGAWIVCDDGQSYRLYCEVEERSGIEIIAQRDVDDGYVELSALTIIGGREHSLRNRARDFLRDWRERIGCSNGNECASANVVCGSYDFGEGASALRLNADMAVALKDCGEKLVASCRKEILSASYDPRVVYFRRRHKKSMPVLLSKCEDVVATSHLYSGLKIRMPAMLVGGSDSTELKKPDMKLPDDAFLCARWPSLDDSGECSGNGATGRVAVVEGLVSVPPESFGNIVLKDWKVDGCNDSNVLTNSVTDSDELLSMDYMSPCREFRLVFCEGENRKEITYCCGLLHVVQSVKDGLYLSVGLPFDALDQMYFDLAGMVVQDRFLIVKQKLRQLAAALGMVAESPLCKVRRCGELDPIVMDAAKEPKIKLLVDDLLKALTDEAD